MRKLILVSLSVLLVLAGQPAQADKHISIDDMVKKYESTLPCVYYRDFGNLINSVDSLINWDSYKNCRENDPYIYDNLMSYAVPNFVLNEKDYNIFLLNCTDNWHQYACPKDSSGYSKPLFLPIKNYSKELMTKYFELYQGNLKAADSAVEDSLAEWKDILAEYDPELKRKELAKRGCFKPLKPFYYTSKTGRYIVSAKMVDEYTIIATAGPEYKTYKYVYTKKEQAKHKKECNDDMTFYKNLYEERKVSFLKSFNIFTYAENKKCFTPNKVADFKSLGTLKCINYKWVKTK